ncbi:MAG: ribonuclease T2 [Pseudolabrys sp.]|jgi:ribonuclease T2
MFRRAVVAAAFAATLVILCLHSAVFAQNQSRTGQRQNTPGQFDFYVLALSWSPSFCASERERASGRTPDQQCGSRPYAFVVHGLWPQYEKGYPSYCQVPAPRLDRSTVSSALELMPSPHLVFHEWDRHGTCSGMNARDYFDAVRKARAAVKIPDEFVALTTARTVTPDAVEDAFVKANPGLSRAGFAVSCDNTRLREIRVCLGKDFGFRDCAEVARLTCKRDSIVMPPVRGGREADAENLQSH